MYDLCTKYLKNNIEEIVSLLKYELQLDHVPTIYLLSDNIIDNGSTASFFPNINETRYEYLQNYVLYKDLDIGYYDTKIGIVITTKYYTTEWTDSSVIFYDLIKSVSHEVLHYYQYKTDLLRFVSNLYNSKTITDEEYNNNILEKEAEKFSKDFAKYHYKPTSIVKV